MRWFITTAALISILILTHIWLETFGLQDHQLSEAYAHRVREHVQNAEKCYHDLAVRNQRIKDNLRNTDAQSAYPASCELSSIPENLRKLIDAEAIDHDEFLRIYSERKYLIQQTDNTLRNEVLPIRTVPLLGIEVPSNDFVTIMAVMSLLFATGVWLNLRSVLSSLVALENRGQPELIMTARLFTAFLTSLETNRSEILARRVRSLAIWLPFLSLLSATIIGYWHPVRDVLSGQTKWNWGQTDILMIHIGLTSVLIFLHFRIATESSLVITQIDRIFNPNQ